MNKLTKIVLSFLMVITCINFSTVQAEDGEEVNYSEPTTVETVSEDPANEVEQEVAQEEPAVEEKATVEEAPAEQPAEEAAPVEEPQQEEVAPEASEEAQVEEANNAPEEAASEEATVAAAPQQEETATPEETQEEAEEEPAEVQKATVEISYVDEENKEIADKVSDKEFDVDFVVTADDKEVYKDIDGYTFKEAIVNDDAENRTFTADTIKLDGLKVTSDMNKVKLVYSKNPVTVKKDTTAKKTSKKSSGLLGALEKAVDTLTGKTEEASDDADPLSVETVADTISLTAGDEQTIRGSYSSSWDHHTWSSDPTGVVEVTGNGRTATLKAIAAGSATITHTYGYYGNKSETWNVTVTRDKEITSVAISGDDSVTVFKNITLTASIEPADVKNVTYTWESSDESILIVNSNGVVTGQKPGTATVTVYASNSETKGVYATKQITVNAATTSTNKADFYYLKTPTSDPKSNSSDQWGATLGKGEITLEGAVWDSNNKNTFNNVGSRVVKWPGGSTGSSYVVPKGNTHWKAIYDKFKSEVGNVEEDEIESIILHPYKISNNETYHVDCTVEIKAKDRYTATYYVWEPKGTGYEWKEAVTKHANETTSPTKTYDDKKTVDGVTYTFSGWYTNQGLTGEKVTFPYTFTNANVNFYAKYVAGYNVEYRLNGGSGTVPNTRYYEVGKTVHVADGSAFTKEGYKFAGWKDGDGNVYASNSTFVMPGKNVTLTAQWTSTAFKVDDLNDVIYSGDSQQLKPVVKDKNNGKKLAEGTDYTVSYSKDTTNVGTVTVTVTGKGNYTGRTVKKTYQITPFPLVVTADDKEKVYGSTEPELTATETSGVEGKEKPDDQQIKYSLSRTAGENVGDYPITASGKAAQGNYTVTYNPGTLTITKKSVDVTVVADNKTKTYGEADPAFTAKVNGTVGEDKINYTLSRAEGEDVGEYAIEVTLGDNPNYEVTKTDAKLTITPKAVTVTADNKSKTYGEADPELTAKVDGTINGDTVDYTLSRATGENAGNHKITVTGEENQGNYKVSYADGKLTINRKSITPDGPETPEEKKTGIEVTNPEGSKYDGTEHKNTPTVTDTKTGKTLTEGTDYTLTYSEDVTNAGTVTVTVTGKGNYTGEFNVTYEITKRDVVLTSATDSKPYDGTPLTKPEVTVGGDGFVDGEGATFAVTGTITNVGTKANTFGYALNKNTLASNYNISTELGTLTITPKTITPDQPGTPDEEKTGITVENPGDVKYDGKDHAEKPVIKDEKTGVTLEEGKDYEIVYPEDIKNAGEITATVVGKGDYDGSFEIKFNILKRDVTFTSATDSKQYDGNALTNGNVEITGDGFIEGEGATFNVTGSITDVGSTNNAFTYAMNEGTNADNYNVTVVEGTLTVSEQPVVPTPVTPTTPSNNTPARTNNVPARAVTNPTTTTPAPEATVEPEKAETTPVPTAKPEKIKEEATPQAAPKGHWALINLIAAMLSVVLAVVALLAKHDKDEDEDDEDKDDQVVANENEDDDENESTRHRRWKVIATIDAILAVVVFILTENISLPMVLVDKWTLLMVLFGLISIVSTYFARKWHEEDEDEDEESSQNA